jgi:pimeloyl-ACP methyl ester carboxylesterase
MTALLGWSTSQRSVRTEGETSLGLLDQYPTDIFSHIEVAEGRVWLLPDGVEYFAGDLSEQVVWATATAPAADLFSRNAPGVAWRSKPSSYIVANNDGAVHPELQRFLAKRMGATTYEVESSHVPMLSQPSVVIDVIRTAATASTSSGTGT